MGLLDIDILCLYKNRMHLRSCIAFVVALQLVLAACGPLRPGSDQPSQATPERPGNAASPAPAATTAADTPVPIVRVTSGDRALFNGDYETAIMEFEAAVASGEDDAVRAAALWGLARALYSDERYEAALERTRQLTADFPASPYLAAASFLEGQCLEALNRPAEAAQAYAAYIITRPGVLDFYASLLRGDALTGAEDFAGALDAYQSAQAAPHLEDAQALQIKIAQSHAALGETETAISLYDTIATNTTNDYTRAQMDYLAAQAFIENQQTEQAHQRLQHAVHAYPVSYYSYLGLVQLLEAGVEVDDLDRGATDYYAGVYDKALEALDRYIADNPGADGTAYYLPRCQPGSPGEISGIG